MWKMRIAALAVFAIYSRPLMGGEPLTLKQAVEKALENHASVKVASAEKKAAEARIKEARGGLFPRVDYTESWQRSNNPVFVFSSLLSQRQFSQQNFDINSLNNPSYLNNFQSQIVAEENVYDSGKRKAQIRAAELGRDLAGQTERRTEADVVAAVVRNYYNVLVARENARVAAEAVKAADVDVTRAESRRDSGVTTDADVLSIRVHRSAMREQQIRREADAQLALAALNEGMGLPLDTEFDLTTTLIPASATELSRGDLEKDAVQNRPELAQARLVINIRESQEKAARASLLPDFFIRAGFEADRQQFFNNGGANWMTAAGMRWNLFRGFSDKARTEAASQEIVRSRAERQLAESGLKLEARRAWLDRQSADQRMEVAQSTVDMATESLRIIRNRYEAGLTDVTELLRAEVAQQEAKTRQMESVRDQRLSVVMMEYTRGTLTRDSDILDGK
jgi:outer membrane protein